MKVIILAAGIGSRLGRAHPKTLTMLATGESILERQIRLISKYVTINNIIIVIGFKKDLIMEEFPNLLYAYNNYYDRTNTAKSLLCALHKIKNETVIWLNGDIVFDENVIKSIVKSKSSCMAVDTHSVDLEEVKYNLNEDKTIKQVSKVVKDGLGEAVGINKILSKHLSLFKKALSECDDHDYFERGLEIIIENGVKLYPIDITQYFCYEIDNEEDYNAVNKYLQL